jgi:hypothetical protein
MHECACQQLYTLGVPLVRWAHVASWAPCCLVWQPYQPCVACGAWL